jgi:molecular chaperone HtpG
MMEKHAFSAEISKVLKLMIHSLYTNKDIFLRELISNASDACDKLRYAAVTAPELLQGDSTLKITLSADKKAKTITVADNGVGMSRDELMANLGTIAKSGTQEFLSALTGDAKKDVSLIGQFGVGFYSAFVVSDRVTVTSRKAGEEKGHVWESDGSGEFTIDEAHDAARGTSIVLHVREGEDAYLDAFRLKHIAQTYSDHISFPIEYRDESGVVETVNKASALWMRPKSEITQDQYKEFYHHIAHSPDLPWMTLHNKAEGKLEYTSLLFIPSIQPFDLFHPERKLRVKLYVKRVFITDEGTDLVPHYLRFLRGVVDSEDLPLNISRETLQQNPLLERIRESIVKRVLSDLKKRAEKEPADYAVFW